MKPSLPEVDPVELLLDELDPVEPLLDERDPVELPLASPELPRLFPSLELGEHAENAKINDDQRSE